MTREDSVLAIADASARAVDMFELARTSGPILTDLMGASHVVFFRRTHVGRLGFPVPGQPDLLPLAPPEADDPMCQHLMTGVPDVAPLSALVDQRMWRRSSAYADFYRPYELEHSIFVRLRDEGGPGCHTGIGIFRPTRPWSRADLGVVTRLRPMLALAAERGRHDGMTARLLLEDIVEAIDDAARFALSLDGRLLWQSERARAWLGPSLAAWPDALVAAAARFVALLRGDGGGALPALRLRHQGRALEVDMRLVRRQSGESVILGRAREPQEASAQARWMATHGLTRAEAAVLEALHAGRGNAEIALALHLSAHTVRTHLLRIFDKLGVATRLQAVIATR